VNKIHSYKIVNQIVIDKSHIASQYKSDVRVRARSDAMREAIILRAMSKAIRCQSESFA